MKRFGFLADEEIYCVGCERARLGLRVSQHTAKDLLGCPNFQVGFRSHHRFILKWSPKGT